MNVVYAKEAPPEAYSKSLFLAGPTPRSSQVASWRPEALELLAASGYDGVVFVPEPRDGIWQGDYEEQIAWEEACLHRADCILFWVPRDLQTLPAFTTNVEFGVWHASGKVVFGAPDEAPKNTYLKYYAAKCHVPTADSLVDSVAAALKMIGPGALRRGGEREIPFGIWKTASFQQWYRAQTQAGNRLDGARVVWTFRVGPEGGFLLYWALHVNVYVASEGRNKSNEVVLARPDISTVMMYRRSDPLEDSELVLIREYRSSAVTPDGFVREIPGGSSFKEQADPLELAAKECEEETGLAIAAHRIRPHAPRQLVAPLSAHRAHLFSVEITADELALLRAQGNVAYGNPEETERTYVQVVKLRDVLARSEVDWSMLGMILSVLMQS